MCIVTLSFGQCGIQLAQDLFTTLYDDINTKLSNSSNLNKEYVNEATERWFTITKRGLWLPRSILIDSDEKTTPLQNKRFKFTSVLTKSFGGCANNWAHGFCSKSNFFVEEIEEKLRQRFESDEKIANILSLFSLGGGTGSGIGTKVLQHVRDCFPEKTVFSVLVFPYNSGEIAVQSYNTVLALSKLYDLADGLIFFENNKLHTSCGGSQNNVSYQHLNALIAKQLTLALQPVKELSVSDLINNLIGGLPHKFVQLRGGLIATEEHRSYENVLSWSALMKEVTRGNYGNLHSLSDVIISRGNKQPDASDIKLITSRNLLHYHQSRSFKNENRNLLLLSNNSSVSLALNCMIEDAWKLFTHGAYLHHYLKYGIDEMYFLNSFEKLETILYDYKNL